MCGLQRDLLRAKEGFQKEKSQGSTVGAEGVQGLLTPLCLQATEPSLAPACSQRS